jgi:catechol 2,3-dioxygenase-like lactoylglutathione lyase family enzyme
LSSFSRRGHKLMRAFLLAGAVLTAAALGVAQMPPPDTLAGIAHVAIRVSDLTRSRSFYQKLGFQQAFALTKDGVTTEAFLKVDDRQFIELYPKQAGESAGFMHLCFESNDLESLNKAYLARSLTPTPVKKAGAGNLLFTLAGPEQQNIEYTQYMPGSLHSKDKGLHLGTDSISTELWGVGLRMEDPVAARTFYEQNLGFHEAPKPLEPDVTPLLLPGTSGEAILITTGPDEVLFAVDGLRHATSQLDTLHIPYKKQTATVTFQDPDGLQLVFVDPKGSWLHLPQLHVPQMHMPHVPWPGKPSNN